MPIIAASRMSSLNCTDFQFYVYMVTAYYRLRHYCNFYQKLYTYGMQITRTKVFPWPNPFPMNAWYAAAWDVDIKHALFPRTICGKHVVMYRQADGQVTALEDACWHRLVPLSKGRLEGDTVVCGYHGLKYNSSGRCTFMPSQETINPSACVRAYPVVERHRFIWLWMGDPALADPALVPDMHWNDDPAWAGDGKTIHVKCDYRLVVDNLMDLTARDLRAWRQHRQ